MKIINPKNKLIKLPFNLGIGFTFSFLHLLFFTSFFVLVSNLVFTPPHRFLNIFNTALSNHFYIALLWYLIFPVIFIYRFKPDNLSAEYPNEIKLKVGSKIIKVPTSRILLISTDKPYSIIHTNDQKILDNKSLKEFETMLDPSIFLRVHRSSILNSKYIKEIKSRSNGDYDARLNNDKLIRLSRHYRNNWAQLLQ
jgi:two-component system LytT family response regulator